ncbi:MAG: sigma-54-dependent Fis family transcriptional regulator [Gammaproteobacteria bacterium]|nr:sigma-54-dependent Fis family transcriptional regulator [Gammaproteobacteria bacterium]MBI5616902.1 sigma-54-dependent Fis family transcriptional regulator [Gammaproteobacteria bacterium]
MTVERSNRPSFPRPQDERQIMAAWERFLSSGEDHSGTVRRLIQDSWERCFHAGVDPARRDGVPLLRTDGLYSVRGQHEDLLEACKPVMAEARDFLAESGTVMLLTDPGGLILQMEGDPHTLDDAQTIHLEPGARWSEQDVGTNAIGTALSAGAPVQVHAAEHFCEGIKRWTCSATVVRDPYDGQLLGALDVSGLSGTYNRHSLALVVTAATRIEERLTQLNLETRHALLDACQSRLAQLHTDEYVVFDRIGRMVKASRDALHTLSLRNPRIPARIGRISDLGATLSVHGAVVAPSWLPAECFEPVRHGGRHIGTILVLPALGHGPRERERSAVRMPRETPAASVFADVIGEAPALRAAVERGMHLARANVPVLLQGETGVGKEVFARAIHAAGPTARGPLVNLNCGGLSRDLLASELFGYADGAFTGARRGGMKGKVEAADGGTLFLDEISEMPLDLQPHLLRVLEGGEVYRLGETEPRKVRFRLVSATNRDLHAEADAGRFRLDLYYRVAVTTIALPPLRERTGDILLLAERFLRDCAELHYVPVEGISPEALAALEAYHWPGNVRELRNAIQSMVLTTHRPVLGMDSLPPHIASHTAPVVALPVRGVASLEQAERAAIEQAILACGANLTRAAAALGISKSTLYAKLKRYGITVRGGD